MRNSDRERMSAKEKDGDRVSVYEGNREEVRGREEERHGERERESERE